MKFLFNSLLLSFAIAATSHADITGIVKSVESNNVIHADIPSGETPKVGDPVTIGFSIPGQGVILIEGHWVVTSSAEDQVILEPLNGEKTAKPVVGYVVTIQTGSIPKTETEPASEEPPSPAPAVDKIEEAPSQSVIQLAPKELLEKASAYLTGTGSSVNFTEAFRLFSQGAELKLPEAYYALGYMYEKGLGVQQDFEKAMAAYQQAAELDYAPAVNNIGMLYYKGLGVPQDNALAVQWLKRAAELNEPLAQANLGYMYQHGLGIPQDNHEAYKWYSLAAGQGDPQGQTNLGWLYENGVGVTQDYKEALEWYQKAADQKFPQAINNLAWMYQEGLGVPKDPDKALEIQGQAVDHSH